MGKSLRQKKGGSQPRGKPKSQPTPAPGRTLAQRIAARGSMLTVAVLILIFFVGFFARFEDYFQLRTKPEIFLFNQQPILATGDGYYYLRLASDLAEGQYNALDAQRRYPDSPPRPSPPPMLSVVTAAAHKVLRASLDWVAVLLPVLVAPLLLLPVYGLTRALGGGSAMGLTAALMAVVSEYYVGRSRLGVFDTDCLIVTLTMAICYFIVRFALDPSTRRYWYACAAAAGFGLYLWWWDQAPEVVSAICLSMFAIAVVFFYRPTRREGLVFAGALAGLTAVFLGWRGLDAPVSLVRGALERLTFVAGSQAGPFPSTVGDVRELQVLGFVRTAELTAGHASLFVLACAGYVWFLAGLKRRALLLAVPTLLAFMPVVFGNRFLIFQVPVIAMGIGYLAERLWRLRETWKPAWVAAVLLALFPPALCFARSTARVFRPPIASSMGAIEAVIEKTPAGATLWTNWWHGYPVQYYARRAVITDGGSLEGPRLVYQNLPLAESDDRLAANFMQFWVGNGSAGMERLYEATNHDHAAALALLRAVCAAGPRSAAAAIETALGSGRLHTSATLNTADDWLSFFFPAPAPPIYLLLTQDMTTSTVWFERGTWDVTRRKGADVYYRPHYGVRPADGHLRGRGGFDVDLESGIIHEVDAGGVTRSYPLNSLAALTGSGMETTEFNRLEGLNFEWIPPLGFGATMSPAIARSVFNRRFIRHESQTSYFRLVVTKTPYYQIWEVRGDSARSGQ